MLSITLDQLYVVNEEIEFKDNFKYCLGFCFLSENKILLETRINKLIFFNYNHDLILDYLINNSYVEPNWNKIEILQFNFIKTNTWFYYSCIIKTFYLKIIQRTWKKIFKQRKEILNNQKKIILFLNKRQLGKINNLKLPTLRGMLSSYAKNI